MSKKTKEEVVLKSYEMTFKLKMISGETHMVTIKPWLYKCPWTAYNSDNNPFILWKPEELLERRIERQWVVDNLNYACVESFSKVESKPFRRTVYKTIVKKLFGTDIYWSKE